MNNTTLNALNIVVVGIHKVHTAYHHRPISLANFTLIASILFAGQFIQSADEPHESQSLRSFLGIEVLTQDINKT